MYYTDLRRTFCLCYNTNTVIPFSNTLQSRPLNVSPKMTLFSESILQKSLLPGGVDCFFTTKLNSLATVGTGKDILKVCTLGFKSDS